MKNLQINNKLSDYMYTKVKGVTDMLSTFWSALTNQLKE